MATLIKKTFLIKCSVWLFLSYLATGFAEFKATVTATTDYIWRWCFKSPRATIISPFRPILITNIHRAFMLAPQFQMLTLAIVTLRIRPKLKSHLIWVGAIVCRMIGGWIRNGRAIYMTVIFLGISRITMSFTCYYIIGIF
jgi:hypothetical protein